MRQTSYKIALFLIPLVAISLIIFSFTIILKVHPGMPESNVIRWSMAIVALVVAIVMFGLYVLMRKGNKTAYDMLIFILAISAFSLIFDDFGWIDLLFFGITLLPAIMLMYHRKYYNNGLPKRLPIIQ
ncbi:MAG: hypothetical protein IH585_19940 [Anaerolineaceae bacterium]|nr:hypothetical protein [Anaerolineaceae bacterium]